jgi:hypothetical protein
VGSQKKLADKYWQRDRDLWSLWPCDASASRNITQHEAKVAEVYALLEGFLNLAFMDGKYDPLLNKELPYDDRDVYGLTSARWNGPELDDPIKDLWIFLNYKTFQPLLREDLTDAERLGLIYFNANTLVHEW